MLIYTYGELGYCSVTLRHFFVPEMEMRVFAAAAAAAELDQKFK